MIFSGAIVVVENNANQLNHNFLFALEASVPVHRAGGRFHRFTAHDGHVERPRNRYPGGFKPKIEYAGKCNRPRQRLCYGTGRPMAGARVGKHHMAGIKRQRLISNGSLSIQSLEPDAVRCVRGRWNRRGRA